MQNFLTIIYFLILGSSIYTKNIYFIAISIITGITILCLTPVFKKLKKQNIKACIEANQPTININKASWWEFEELPCFSKIQAKKAVYIRRHEGKYSSKEDFYEKNTISDENIKIIDKLIYL